MCPVRSLEMTEEAEVAPSPVDVTPAAVDIQQAAVRAAALRLANQDHSEFLLEEYENEKDTLRALAEQLSQLVRGSD